jgi:hypothetical protein
MAQAAGKQPGPNREDRRRRARERRPEEPPAVVDLDEEQDDVEPDEIEEIELFRWEGEMYYMTRPPANLSLKLLMNAREDGREIALAQMLHELVEPEALDILQGKKKGKDGQPARIGKKAMATIMDRIMHFALGNLEDTLGN